MLIHRLRKQLISGGQPEDEYIEIRNGTMAKLLRALRSFLLSEEQAEGEYRKVIEEA